MIPTAEEQPVLHVHEVAKILGISRASAYNGTKSGEIPTIKVGSRVLVPTAWLRRVLQLDAEAAEADATALQRIEKLDPLRRQ